MAEPELPGDIVRDDAPAFPSQDRTERAGAAPHGESSVSGVAVTINRTPAELYRYWRDFANPATFMRNVERIDVIDRERSHRVVAGPNGTIGCTTENADVPNSGQVSFADAAPDRHGADAGTTDMRAGMLDAPVGRDDSKKYPVSCRVSRTSDRPRSATSPQDSVLAKMLADMAKPDTE